MTDRSERPQQYKKGWVEFYKLRFKVTPDVLIPRPETELLVDKVLEFISYLQTTLHELPPITVLDVGTGAGNIAISVAKNSNNVQIIATDVSGKALKIAKQNAKLHGVSNKIIFIQSNLLYSFYYDTLVYHSKINPNIIVANLPYIPSARIPYLDSSVKDSEPNVALDGGEDGFELCRKLFQQIKQLSNPVSENVSLESNLQTGIVAWKPKLIICEIDYTHEELASNEAYKYFPQAEIEVKKDLAHQQRILTIRFSLDN